MSLLDLPGRLVLNRGLKHSRRDGDAMGSVRIELGKGVALDLAPAMAATIHRQLGTALGADRGRARTDRAALPEDHPLWTRHSGQAGHSGPEWENPGDQPLAEAFYSGLRGKGRIWFDLLLEYPGVQLSVDELVAAEPEVFTNSRSIAGAINGLRKAHEASGRRYPFYWWEGTPTRYAVKPSVAELFHHARKAVG